MIVTVRPTLSVLRQLRGGSESVARAQKILADAGRATSDADRARILTQLQLGDLTHPLLDDARRGFSRGELTTHRSSTAKFGQPVYEVRDRAGAAWRGAVVCLQETPGTAWLVFVDKHDEFHTAAATFFASTGTLLKSLDKQLWTRETARAVLTAQRLGALRAVLTCFTDALASGARSDAVLPKGPWGAQVRISIDIEHDTPALHASDAHRSAGLVDVSIIVDSVEEFSPIMAVLDYLCRQRSAEWVWKNKRLVTLLTLSHAEMAQLSADLDAGGEIGAPERAVGRPALHYVGSALLLEAVVEGLAVQALCGEWFVPLRDEAAELPVCGDCEERLPLAQQILDRLRQG